MEFSGIRVNVGIEQCTHKDLGRSAINIVATKREWESLERKLRQGKSLDRASLEAGIPIEEARTWAQEQLSHAGKSDLVSLTQTADDAMEAGLRALKDIANDAAHEDRIEAAKSLVRLALDAKKLVVTGGGFSASGKRGIGATIQVDLFDDRGDWDLTDPTKV